MKIQRKKIKTRNTPSHHETKNNNNNKKQNKKQKKTQNKQAFIENKQTAI